MHPELDTNLGAEMALPVSPELQGLLDGDAAGGVTVVRRTFRQQRQTNVPMETRGIVAEYEPCERGDARG